MTTYDAAVRLNLARGTVDGYCLDGTLKATKNGGRDYWIEPAEVDRYQRERRPVGRPAPPPIG